MEARILHCSGVRALPTSRKPQGMELGHRRWNPNPKLSTSSGVVEARVKTMERTAPAAATEKTTYKDSWFDRLAIRYLSEAVQATTDMRNKKELEGYEGLVEAAIMVSKKFDTRAQQDMVIQSLKKAFPIAILTMIRTLLPPSRFGREYFAAFTTVFFPWLIGHCEVRKSEVKGKTEKNVVYIPKCRFLESTKCVGMCTNLCKIPTQKFIQDSFGMPVYMVPNFEDMSCEMIFGQEPPLDDPTLKHPCYHKSCIAKQTHGVNCSSG